MRKYEIRRNGLTYYEASTLEEAQDAMNKVAAFVLFIYKRRHHVNEDDIQVGVSDKFYNIATDDGKYYDHIEIIPVTK